MLKISPVVLHVTVLLLFEIVLQQRHLVCPHLKLPCLLVADFVDVCLVMDLFFCMLFGARMFFRVRALRNIILGLLGI